MSDGLTLEKAKIVEKLSNVENRLIALETSNSVVIKSIDENLSLLNKIVLGNGSPGYGERIRTLEKAEDKRKAHFLIIWTAIVGVSAKTIWTSIFGK